MIHKVAHSLELQVHNPLIWNLCCISKTVHKFPLPSDRAMVIVCRIRDQHCFTLFCVLQLYTKVCTYTRAALRDDCCFRVMFNFGEFCIFVTPPMLAGVCHSVVL